VCPPAPPGEGVAREFWKYVVVSGGEYFCIFFFFRYFCLIKASAYFHHFSAFTGKTFMKKYIFTPILRASYLCSGRSFMSL